MPKTQEKKGQQIAVNTAKKRNSPGPGLPRFDQIDRRLHCFYEPLVLLRILEPTRGSRKHDMPFESTDESFRSCCHKFIDSLSLLCDYGTGGRTVSSIGIEDAPQGPIYWLAANENPNEKVRAHLERILKQLESLRSSSKEASLAIRQQSIQFSREKVKHYIRRLGFAVNDARRSMGNQMSANESVLFQQLDSLQEMNDDHDLVARAFDLRHGDFDRLLNQNLKIAGTADWCHWHMIRHYIGRLRSWPRSAEMLVRLATKHPHLVSDFSCEVVPKTSPMRSPSPDGKSNLDGILRRMVDKSENERLEKLQNSLNCMRHFDIEEDFQKKYAEKSKSLRIHSELQILEHFYSDDRKFLNNDRYIGCSKPSCYCCELYIRLHPGMFESRACHGNLWTNWAFPVDIRSPSSVYAKKILDGMIEHVRRDLLQQIESKLPQRRKWPDSTTGMSRSILASNSIRTDLAENLHQKPAPATNVGRSGLVPDGDDIEQSLTEAMINVHLSQRDKSIMPKATRGTNLNMHEFGIRSRVGSGLHEELVAIEKNDWQDADEGGVLLIACEEDFTRK